MINEKEIDGFVENLGLEDIRRSIPKIVQSAHSHGDYAEFEKEFSALPEFFSSSINLNENQIRIGAEDDISDVKRKELKNALLKFQPWRKGPYNLFGIEIDTEWRSDLKWDRLKDSIGSLDGKKVLDVGCGNGYHCWRALGSGAEAVLGIDPYLLSNVQFQIINKYARSDSVNILPVRMENFPENVQFFDAVFSMGVLYHRRSPFEHLAELRGAMKTGGELILETLVIEGGEGKVLVPEDRYAKMRNVWFIPSPLTLESWLKRAGFKNIRLVSVAKTTEKEQRKTEWMKWKSLNDFLDPSDKNKTIEGYPAPLRAIFVCVK